MTAPLYLFTEVKGMICVAWILNFWLKAFATALIVALSWGIFWAKIAISLLNSSLVTLTGITSSTSILGSVIVPVLSTHSTLTRANVSTLFISWSITWERAKRIAANAKAIVVNKYRPSGIIPIIAASIETILSAKFKWFT